MKRKRSGEDEGGKTIARTRTRDEMLVDTTYLQIEYNRSFGHALTDFSVLQIAMTKEIEAIDKINLKLEYCIDQNIYLPLERLVAELWI